MPTRHVLFQDQLLVLSQTTISQLRVAAATSPPTCLWPRAQDEASGFSGRHGLVVGSVAVIPIYGFLAARENVWIRWFGGTAITRLRAAFRAALAEEAISAIVFDVDSPGGEVNGTPEFAAEIRRARGTKPIVAVTDTMAASGAYYLASQADELIAAPSAMVGSIGVYAEHHDLSRWLDDAGITVTLIRTPEHKAEGHEAEPLSDDTKAVWQEEIEAAYAQFVADVAAGRGVKAAEVKARFGGGRVVRATVAKAAGMIDRIATLDETLTRLTKQTKRPLGARMATVRADLDGPAVMEVEGDQDEASVVTVDLGPGGAAGDSAPADGAAAVAETAGEPDRHDPVVDRATQERAVAVRIAEAEVLR